MTKQIVKDRFAQCGEPITAPCIREGARKRRGETLIDPKSPELQNLIESIAEYQVYVDSKDLYSTVILAVTAFDHAGLVVEDRLLLDGNQHNMLLEISWILKSIADESEDGYIDAVQLYGERTSQSLTDSNTQEG